MTITSNPPKVISAHPKGLSPTDQEIYEYYWKLRTNDRSLRVLEASEAAEIGPMIPVPVIEQIFSMRAEYSLIDKLGIKRHPTSTLITNVASEVTGHAIQAAVLEEGAYQANEPAFVLTAVTVIKYGSLVTVTEEALEDQALFQSWFPGACARMMGLQENAILYARLAAAGTAGVHLAAANTLTEAQLETFYTAMPDPWRDGAKVVTCTANMFSMRALLIATPRAYMTAPEFNTQAGSPGQAMWMGMPMFLNSNWPTLAAAGDAVEVITMVNPDAVIFVERKSLEIKVDPYGNAVNGRTRFYPSARFNIAAPIPLGVVHLTDHA